MQKTRSSDARKTAALLKSLPHVPFDGWAHEADDLFPRGTLDLMLYFSAWADGEMLKKLGKKDLAGLRVRDKVTKGVRARLEALAPHKDAFGKALAYLAPPPRNIYLPKLVWKTADAIWRAAGDTATDYNHYTKRILLSGVLVSTSLYWLNDDSPRHEKTWAFLDRRIDNVLKIGAAAGKLRKSR